MDKWYKNAYSRLLIDNHITEQDPSFMTKFDPDTYVAMVKKAGVESSMVYACCHNGNCYYPTKVGHMHVNLAGRDIFGEVIDGLNKENIDPIAYYTGIYHNQSAKDNPGWRAKSPAEQPRSGRYWFSCPNSKEYREFTKRQIREIIAYPVKGIFIDMTFWPDICTCDNCRNEYRTRYNAELPETMDWNNPEWVRFQRFREDTMGEYAAELTEDIRKANPDISVTHQNSPFISGWLRGQGKVHLASDYISGDFYGGRTEHIFGCRAFAAGSLDQPFEFMTSRCYHLWDHTSTKSDDKMKAEAATTLAAGGAYFFIDAINPDGTLDPKVYETFSRVNTCLAPFTDTVRELKPVLDADTAVFFSPASMFNTEDNGKPLSSEGGIMAESPPLLQEYLGTSLALTRAHIPFKVVTAPNLDLAGIKNLIVINARQLSKEETGMIRSFVKNGGTLFATGATSLQQPDGSTAGDLALADVLGVTAVNEEGSRINYLSFPDGKLVSCHSPYPRMKAAGAEVLAVMNEPLFPVGDPEKFASIHSNPPGKDTDFVGLSKNTFGKGTAYCLAPPVAGDYKTEAQLQFMTDAFAAYLDTSYISNTDAPPAVEIAVTKSPDKNAYVVSLVNWQETLPNIPARDVTLSVKLPGVTAPFTCTRISDGKEQKYFVQDGAVTMTIPCIKTIEMIRIDY